MSKQDGRRPRIKRYLAIGVLIIGWLLLIVVGCMVPFRSKEQQIISYIINNLAKSEEYFAEKGLQLSVRVENEQRYLEVSTAQGIKYLFEDNPYYTRLYRIECQVSREERGVTYKGALTIHDIEGTVNKTAEVVVRPEDKEAGLLVALKYCLPDFEEVQSYWGDYMDAQLKIELWITPAKMKALYENGLAIEKMIIVYGNELREGD